MKIKALISLVIAFILLAGTAFAAEPGQAEQILRSARIVLAAKTAQAAQADQAAQTTQAVQSAQEPKPVEVPDIKIIMDGELAKFEKAPLSVNNSTLLPLRELLVKLGVPNDDEHISYNSTEKSVTIWDGKTRIFFLIGQKEAYVDDKPIALNAAPILYRNSAYIPLRFVAETLKRKVVWEGASKTVFICDTEKYENIRQILDKCIEKSAKIKKYKQELDIKVSVESNIGSTEIGVSSQSAVDYIEKKMFMKTQSNVMGVTLSAENYYSENASYTKGMLTDGWTKYIYEPTEYNKLFSTRTVANILANTEVLAAGLNQLQDENGEGGSNESNRGSSGNENGESRMSSGDGESGVSNGRDESSKTSENGEDGKAIEEILLEGNSFPVDFFKKSIEAQSFGFDKETLKGIKYGDFSMRIALDKNTFIVNSIIMRVKMIQPAKDATDGAETIINVDMELRFSDYNGDFVISVPDEAVKNAVLAQ